MKILILSIVAFVSTACSANSDSKQPASSDEAVAASAASPQPDEAPAAEPSSAPADSGRRVPPGVDTGKGCGGFLGDTCKADEYCAYEPGAHCGAADASATCKPRPSACTKDYRPVCGCDNKTYGNACTANAAGQGLLSLGECAHQQ